MLGLHCAVHAYTARVRRSTRQLSAILPIRCMGRSNASLTVPGLYYHDEVRSTDIPEGLGGKETSMGCVVALISRISFSWPHGQ